MHLIIFASALHDSESVISCRKILFEQLKDPKFLQTHGLPSEGELTITDCSAESLPQENVVCFIATGGTEELFRSNLDRLPDGEIILLSDGYHNSFAASFEIASFLEQRGRRARMVNLPLPEAGPDSPRVAGEKAAYTLPTLDEIYDAKVLDYLAHSTVGLIGGSSSWLISSGVDTASVSEKFGVKFVDIPIDELITEYSAVELGSTVESGLCGALEDKRVRDAEAMQLALEHIVEKYSLTALTLKCFDLLGPCRTTSCLALARINDKGIVCGCEGDLPSLWTMMVVYARSGKAPFMANPSSSDSEALSVDFAHCTIPLGMTLDYKLQTHFESGIGVGIAGTLPLGRYAICKIAGAKLDKLFYAEGEITANTHIAARCRTQVSFRFDNRIDFERFMNNRLGNHIVLEYLNH